MMMMLYFDVSGKSVAPCPSPSQLSEPNHHPSSHTAAPGFYETFGQALQIPNPCQWPAAHPAFAYACVHPQVAAAPFPPPRGTWICCGSRLPCHHSPEGAFHQRVGTVLGWWTFDESAGKLVCGTFRFHSSSCYPGGFFDSSQHCELETTDDQQGSVIRFEKLVDRRHPRSESQS